MYLSQPALTVRIRKLEQDIGVALFERRANGIRLTEAGKNFLPHAERTLESARLAREAAQVAKPDTLEALRLGSGRVVGTYVLPDVVARFRKHYATDVHIRSGRSVEVLSMVLGQEVDIGIARGISHPEIDVLHLYKERVILVAHPEHRLVFESGVRLRDVIDEALILYDRDSEYYAMIERFCREAGRSPRVHMVLDSVEATKQMVQRGLGISFLPKSAVQRDIKARQIAEIPLVGSEIPSLDTAAMVLRRAPQRPLVRTFLEMLREELAETLPQTDGG